MFLKCRFAGTAAAVIALLLGLTLPARGDLKYQELTQMTGGMLESMTKVMGFFGAKGLNKTSTTHYIKGNRMRTDSFTDNQIISSEIVDLDKEEIVSIDHKKKSYAVVTFEQMRQQMEKAIQSMKERKKEAPKQTEQTDVKVKPKISIKDTGESKVINGYQARLMKMSFQFEAENQKSKEQGSMGMDSDLWLTKEIAGFEEQKAFYQKYAAKMASTLMVQQMGMMASGLQDPRMGEAMEEMKKNADKMEGVAVMTVASFNVSGTSKEGNQSAPSEPKSKDSGSKDSSSKDSSSVDNERPSLGKVLGGFGGLGGFGRKKKKTESEQPAAAPQAQPSSSSQPSSGTANLMTMTTELRDVTQASLDASLFEVPRGYKLVKKDE
jgi:hypothetical protein